jgi:hypothetical protein
MVDNRGNGRAKTRAFRALDDRADVVPGFSQPVCDIVAVSQPRGGQS